MEGTELNNRNIMEPCCEDLSPISFDNRLLKFNYRLTAETNERVLVTRQRALHDTDFDTHNAGEAMLTQLAKRVDDPLADPEVLVLPSPIRQPLLSSAVVHSRLWYVLLLTEL